jgi:hypothetical protein
VGLTIYCAEKISKPKAAKISAIIHGILRICLLLENYKSYFT